MKEYKIVRTEGKINWELIPALKAELQPWQKVEGIAMEQKLCCNEEGLHVYQLCTEKNIRAEVTEEFGQVCNDSCMEFFFAPVSGDERYINFEINPNGSLCLGIGLGRADRIRLMPKDPKELFKIETGRTDDGWFVRYTIPNEFIRTLFYGFKGFEAGMEIGANVYKCGNLTALPHYLTWNPMSCPKPDYHRSCDFGRMIIE